MEINRNNYEVWFLDFIEGKLAAAETERLMTFLAENPDLDAELKAFENVTLVPESVAFLGKSLLKKDNTNNSEINESNFDSYCVAMLEGDLNPLQTQQFEAFLASHPAKISDYKLYLKTILEPDTTIIFDNKARLKHRTVASRTRPLIYALAAAASLALVVLVYNAANKNDIKPVTAQNQNNVSEVNNNQLATKTVPNTKVEIIKNYKAKIEKQTTPIQANTIKKDTVDDFDLKPLAKMQIAQISIGERNPELAPIKEFKVITTLQLAQKSKPTAPKYLSVKQYLFKNFKEAIKQDSLPFIDKKDMDLWALAKSGAIEINKFAGTKFALNREVDTSNNRTVYAFNSGLLGFYSSKHNK